MQLTLEQLQQIRTLTIIALFSDDDLMDTLVLKGGNALEIGYGLNSRASIDVDLSMVQDFQIIGLENAEDIEKKLHKVLDKTFEDEGYKVFDVKVKQKPKVINPRTEDFWGGYEANFKIIEIEKYEEYKDNPLKLNAKAIGVNQDKKNIKIDFGRFEYCGLTKTKNIQGYEIQIYTPEMIVFEKIRAICQQMPEYLVEIEKDPKFGRPRPRDFYDIYTVLEHPSIPTLDLSDKDNVYHLQQCFEAKKVPLYLIGEIKNTRDFHKQEESKLFESILEKKQYQGFDFYFDYVIKMVSMLEVVNS